MTLVEPQLHAPTTATMDARVTSNDCIDFLAFDSHDLLDVDGLRSVGSGIVVITDELPTHVSEYQRDLTPSDSGKQLDAAEVGAVQRGQHLGFRRPWKTGQAI